MNMMLKMQAEERADWKRKDEERRKRKEEKQLRDEERWLTLFQNNCSLLQDHKEEIEKKETSTAEKAEMARLQARADQVPLLNQQALLREQEFDICEIVREMKEDR